MASVSEAVPDATFELWAEDEARIGLHPIERRVWAPRGHRPIAVQRPGYEWLYVYGFVRPSTGEVQWLLLPNVNTAVFNIALAHFAAAVGACESKRVILVIDNAGWHVSDDVVWPVGVHPLFLPPYSPELQPAEKLWPLLREPLANRLIESIDDVESILIERCRVLDCQREHLRSCTLMPWWRESDPMTGQTS